jgi:hypothetical protein
VTNRIILGQRSSGRIGLYASRSGIDVLTCNDADLVFNSDAIQARILEEATVSLASYSAAAGQWYRWRVTHPNYGFIPLIEIQPVTGFDEGYTYYSYNPSSSTTTSFCIVRGSTANNNVLTFPACSFIYRVFNLVDASPFAWTLGGTVIDI